MEILAFLGSLDTVSLLLLFWYTTVLEIPRDVVGGVAVAIAALSRNPGTHPTQTLR